MGAYEISFIASISHNPKNLLNNKLPSSLQTAFPNVIPAERG